ncbi:MAG: hypothetical protein GPOALKHO_000580 [Sodalis sp.]|uniref:hypothetical protein n=1 Tax=Sodalis sp. (in: enterobacteria) TaxID=1898979 RepID=UPI003872B32C|nr:MAG: hypothetical protein GPOALKHO_000580 [Sodalis sp.]
MPSWVSKSELLSDYRLALVHHQDLLFDEQLDRMLIAGLLHHSLLIKCPSSFPLPCAEMQ